MNDLYDGSSSLSATEQRLAAELTALADSPAPTAVPDTSWSIRSGRSRLRRRRLAVLGAVTAVAVGAATLSTAWPEAGSGSGSAVQAAGSGSTATVPVGPRVGPDTGHDPLVVQATFGWLPAGFDAFVYNKGFTGQPEAAQAKAIGPKQTDAATDFNRQLLFLTVYGAGVEPPLDLGAGVGLRYRVDTAPVNGRPAYWVGIAPGDPSAGGQDRTLRFELADGRWAELHASYVGAPDNVANMMAQVAAGVHAAPQAVALPFTITDVPPGLVQSGSSLDHGVEATRAYPWTASVGFTLNGKPITVSARPDVAPATTAPAIPGALQPPKTCRSSNGLKLCVSAMEDGEAPFASIGGFNGLLDRVTSLGTDENAWTTEVFN
ncbi:hypothetical protein ACFXAF_26595 [Kitasatospora sp. NPDC059463]|uniref:hypothetical protein n=1 Tax=unclassified Kitasatospora TaxID=2633591 RepID=UPI003677AC84